MSIILISGFLFLMLLLFSKTWLTRIISPSNSVVQKLASSAWFEHTGLSGMFLFLINTLLFESTAALLFLLTEFYIPYLHLVVIIAAVLISLYVWILIYHADRKKRKDRSVMGLIGSSFYLLLFSYAVYRIFMPMETSAVEQDQFMEFIAMFFLSIITFTAWIVCFGITGLYRKQRR